MFRSGSAPETPLTPSLAEAQKARRRSLLHIPVSAAASGKELEPDPVVGVDLGTSYLRAAVVQDGALLPVTGLEALPAQLDRVDALLAEGVIGGERPNAADFQVAPSVRLMQCFDQLLEG